MNWPAKNDREHAEVEPGSPTLVQNEVAVLQNLLEQEHERHLRTRADFANYRRRTERDRDVAAAQGRQDLLLALVEWADDFDRALIHVDEIPAQGGGEAPGSGRVLRAADLTADEGAERTDRVAAGLIGMRRRLSRLLEAEGVRSFESLGCAFDPTRHQALATVAETASAAGTVVQELGRGYLWNDRLLRPARVRVAE